MIILIHIKIHYRTYSMIFSKKMCLLQSCKHNIAFTSMLCYTVAMYKYLELNKTAPLYLFSAFLWKKPDRKLKTQGPAFTCTLCCFPAT